jgi:hypothetical protein
MMPVEPRIDYLRLATWDLKTYTSIAAIINEHHLTKPAHWLQYHGRRSDDGGVFHGQGVQGHRNHYITHSSGQQSDTWASYFLDKKLDAYCTRIDIQATIEEPDEHCGRKLYELVHRKTKSIVQSPGITTVYIGARASQLFIRVYEKVIEQRYLRCEFELKQDYARNAWDALGAGAVTKEDLFSSCLARSGIIEPWLTWFKVNSDCRDALSAEKLAADLQNQLLYIKNTEIALERLLYSHPTQQAVYGLIGRLENKAKRLR